MNDAAQSHQAALLACRSLHLCAGERLLIEDLSLGLQAGKMLCVLGRNGAGKTTLLHTLAGLRTADSGTVLVDGLPLESLPRRELARRVGVVLQRYEDPFPSTVMEMTLIGRHPHIGFWRWEGSQDHAAARAALAAVDLEHFEDRQLETLSGGERRRLAIATVLAQAPAVYVLDEPVQQLDPNHQLAVMQHFRALADAGAAVIVSLHDVNLAARFSDQTLLLFGDGEWLCGPTATTLRPDTLERLYGTPIARIEHGGRTVFVAS